MTAKMMWLLVGFGGYFTVLLVFFVYSLCQVAGQADRDMGEK